ncbi:3637_t:CDS:2, partial [Gigaspora margarita]
NHLATECTEVDSIKTMYRIEHNSDVLETSKYPENNPFLLKQNNTIYKYHVINEEFYPPENKVCYTAASSRDGTRYEVPDNYLVQTSWRRTKSCHMVECEIMYEQDGPVYIIRFEKNSQQYVLKSKKSSTAVANDYLQKKCPNTRATISGIHVFGLNATDMEQECKRKKRQPHSLKLFNSLSESMKTKRSRAFSIHLGKTFDNEVPKFFNSFDRPILQEIKFNIQNKDYVIDYKNNDKENRDRLLDPFIEVIDCGPISHHAYRKLAAIQPELP